MNQYVSFHTVLDLIEKFQQESPILNTYGYGNLVDFTRTISGDTQNTPVRYPYLFAVPMTVEYSENTTIYQVSLIFTDIINTDYMNEKDIISDMSLQARRFLSYVKRGIQTFPELYDNFDIELPVQAIPFMERMGDHVAGVAMDVNLIVFEDINACDYYSDYTSVYSQVLTFTGTPNYNSIQYQCSGTTVEACYSIENQNTMVDLVDLFNSPPPDPLPGSCDNPTFCYCWTDYGTYYDNGDGRIRCEMPTTLYNTLCPSGVLTLNVIND